MDFIPANPSNISFVHSDICLYQYIIVEMQFLPIFVKTLDHFYKPFQIIPKPFLAYMPHLTTH